MLPAGEEHDPARPVVVMGFGERLGEQDRRAGVDGPVAVEDVGGQLAEAAVGGAAGVVGDQDVDLPEQVGGAGDQLLGSVGPRQVGGGVGETGRSRAVVSLVIAELGEQRLQVVAAPHLGFVVGSMVVNHHRGAEPDQAAGDREPDPGTAADASDDRDPPGQGRDVLGRAVGAHDLDSRAAVFGVAFSADFGAESVDRPGSHKDQRGEQRATHR